MGCIRVAGLITIIIKLFRTLFIIFLPVDVKHIFKRPNGVVAFTVID